MAGEPQVSPAEEVDDSRLQSNESNIVAVLKHTSKITDWSYLGLLIGLSETDLERLKHVPDRHKAIVKCWLNYGKSSWAILVSALRDDLVNKHTIANDIAQAHRPKKALLQKSYTYPSESHDEAQIKKWQIKIENCIKRADFRNAQGIILVIGINGPDGTARDVENITSTFKHLNFAVYMEQDPSSSDIIKLVSAATWCRYPANYKYFGFYFAGHGGRDTSGHAFIRGLEVESEDDKIVYVEEDIFNPLKILNQEITRLFFFDCCQTINQYRDHDSSQHRPHFTMLKQHPNQVVAYAASESQQASGDERGGIWTYHLCQNLKKNITIQNVLAKTYDDVKKERSNFQIPMTSYTIGEVTLMPRGNNDLDESSVKVDEDGKTGDGKKVEEQKDNMRQYLMSLLKETLENHPYLSGFLCAILSIITSGFWFTFYVCLKDNALFNGALVLIIAETSPVIFLLMFITAAFTICALYFIRMKYRQERKQ